MAESSTMQSPQDLMLEIHLSTSKKLKEYVTNTEQHFTWLQEILVEAKRSFSSPQLQLLPKTPSAKRTRRQAKIRKEYEEDTPPRKKASTETTESSVSNTTKNNTSSRSMRSTRNSKSTKTSRSTRSKVKQEVLSQDEEDSQLDLASISEESEATENENIVGPGFASPALKVSVAKRLNNSVIVVDMDDQEAETDTCDKPVTVVDMADQENLNANTEKNQNIKVDIVDRENVHEKTENRNNSVLVVDMDDEENLPAKKRKSLKRKSVLGVRSSLSKRRSSSVAASNWAKRSSVIKPDVHNRSRSGDNIIVHTPEKPTRPPRSKLRLKKSQKESAVTAMSSSTDEEKAFNSPLYAKPVRVTRSKMRPKQPSPNKLNSTSSEDDHETPKSDDSDQPNRFIRSTVGDHIATSDDDPSTPTPQTQGFRGAGFAAEISMQTAYQHLECTPEKRAKHDSRVFTPSNTSLRSRHPASNASFSHTQPRIVKPVQSFLSAQKKKHSNFNTLVTSFIPQQHSAKKPSLQEKMEKQRKEMMEKELKSRSNVSRMKEMARQKIEEQRRKREERTKLAQQKRLQQEQREKEQFNRIRKEKEELRLQTVCAREERVLEEKKKRDLREQRLAEAEEKRKRDEEYQLQKQQELEEQRRLEEERKQQLQREERERQKYIEEQRKLEEEKRLQRERELIRRQEELKKQEEEREIEEQRKRKEREERERREKAERERLERDKVKEKERQRMIQIEKEKEMERKRLQELKERAAREAEEQKRLQSAVNKHNHALHNNSSLNTSSGQNKSMLNHSSIAKHNSTISKANTSIQSYEITPQKKAVIHPNRFDEDNYDISDLKSDESTDDEERPRKPIPSWATGTNFKASLISQYYHPPDLDTIGFVIDPLDLNLVFKKKKPRFNKRTSSALWTSPILKPSGKLP